jgi:hypothetical protein
MIDFGAFKIAIEEITIDKSYGNKEARSEIAIGKCTIFVFFVFDIVF